MKRSLFIFPFMLAGVLASYWRDELKSMRSAYSPLGRVQQNSQFDCKQVTWKSRKLFNNQSIDGGWILVCHTEDGLCYTTNITKCCQSTGLGGVVTTAALKFGSQSVDVKVLYGGYSDVCAVLGSDDDAINLCPSGGARCLPPLCQPIPEICANNSNGDCDPSGCLNCQEGYVEPSCCECEDNYVRASNGSCLFVCASNCNGPNGDCTSCAHPYTGAPFCCDCTPPFVKKDDGTCGCPPDYIEIDGTCELPCIDNQYIIMVMDRSTGIGQTELWAAMYAIEIFTGALLRGTRNLTVDVVAYAKSLEETQLRKLTPDLYTGKLVTPSFCNRTLKRYERNIRDTTKYPKPKNTYSGRTIQLLKDMVVPDTKTTVITFSGTLSNKPSQNLKSISQGIEDIKAKVGSGNVQFFGAGFEAENYEGDQTRKDNYIREVTALGDNKSTQSAVVNIDYKAASFLKAVTEMLFNSGVLCKDQRDTILSVGSDSTINARFLAYETCVVNNEKSKKPCISKPDADYNYICLNETVRTAAQQTEDAELSLLTVVKQLLEKLSN